MLPPIYRVISEKSTVFFALVWKNLKLPAWRGRSSLNLKRLERQDAGR
jgi:hypothetical protein